MNMNKHTYTFLTLFLLISSLFGNPVRGDEAPVFNIGTYVDDLPDGSTKPALDFTDPKVNSQYYMIGSTTNSAFLKAGDSGSGFTVLAANGKISEAWPSDEELSAYLWKVEPYRPEGMASYTGYKLKNKKTGLYLKLNLSTTLPTKDDNAAYDIFTWFTDCTKITNEGACLMLNPYQLYLVSDGTTKLTNQSTPDEANKLYIYTLKSQPIIAKTLNDSMGDGFTLSATKDGKKLAVPDNPLLDKKLVAMTFKGVSGISAEAKKITGGESSEKTYFIASGAKKLMELATDSKITFSIDAENVVGNEKAVLAAFKEATFVAVNNVQIYTSEISVTDVGLGYNYATFTGSALLNADVTQVPIENARFKVEGAEGDNLTITNPEAKFPKDGNMTESVVEASSNMVLRASGNPVGVRPLILQLYELNKINLITAPANGTYTWTPIGFSASAGSIPSDEFKDKSVSVTIADLEVKKKGTDEKDVVATEVALNGWKISPSSYSTEETTSEGTKYNNNVSFTQAANVAANMPEDCWALTKVNGHFLLKNRETAKYIDLGTTLYQVADDLYQLKEPLVGDCQGQPVKIDSLRLTEVKLGELDGYAHCKAESDAFDKSVLANTPYRLGVTNASFDGTLFYATSYTGELTVTSKQDDGLAFILTPCDTIPYGIYTEKDDKKVYDLRRVRYALQDQNSGRYVRYDQIQGICVLDASAYNSAAEALSNATKFYLKEKGSDQYELIVSTGYYDATNNNAWAETGGNLKIYTNTSAKLSTIGFYTPITGDKFTLVTKQSELSQDNILTKLLGKSDTTLVRLNFLSTMNGSGSQPWMLAVDKDRFLVEGQPISKPNIDIDTKAQGGLEYEAVHFSLILDTAYVQRAGVTTPLYYIAMPSDKSSEQIQQVGKKTVGYYLFAMTDSIYNGADKNTREDRYCYHFWSQHNPRLRFVQATHEGDTIYIETANPSAKDTIQAGSTEGVALAARQRAWLAAQSEGTAGNPQNNTNKGINYGLFAFEANPKAAEGSLEYALWNPASGRYVTYLNGNVVLTQEPTYYKLDVSRPDEGHFVVANEPVVSEPEVFQVIARSGQVEIRQAAGRQVQIYNILGKELVTKRLSSDAETISLPKGIAIVVVEGETPIKVVI